MKKIKDEVLDYLCFITKLKFSCLMGTFCRILVYCLVCMDFINGKILIGVLLLCVNLFSTSISIYTYQLQKGRLSNVITKRAKKSFTKSVVNSIKLDFDDLSLDEQIEMLESFNDALKDILVQSETELQKLKEKKESDNEK